MFITKQALEHAQLDVHLDDDGLHIDGREALPKEARRNVKDIAGQLGYSPQEHDELMSYVANVTIWSRLKSITSF